MNSKKYRDNLEAMVKDAKGMIDAYLDYAEKYKLETEKYVDALLEEAAADGAVMEGLSLAAVINANTSHVDKQINEVSTNVRNAKYLFDRKGMKIYVFC